MATMTTMNFRTVIHRVNTGAVSAEGKEVYSLVWATWTRECGMREVKG